jgi:hypothetical protein
MRSRWVLDRDACLRNRKDVTSKSRLEALEAQA